MNAEDRKYQKMVDKIKKIERQRENENLIETVDLIENNTNLVPTSFSEQLFDDYEIKQGSKWQDYFHETYGDYDTDDIENAIYYYNECDDEDLIDLDTYKIADLESWLDDYKKELKDELDEDDLDYQEMVEDIENLTTDDEEFRDWLLYDIGGFTSVENLQEDLKQRDIPTDDIGTLYLIDSLNSEVNDLEYYHINGYDNGFTSDGTDLEVFEDNFKNYYEEYLKDHYKEVMEILDKLDKDKEVEPEK